MCDARNCHSRLARIRKTSGAVEHESALPAQLESRRLVRDEFESKNTNQFKTVRALILKGGLELVVLFFVMSIVKTVCTHFVTRYTLERGVIAHGLLIARNNWWVF